MNITKHNICESIENFLKSKHIKFSIDDPEPRGVTYELYVGSLSCFLQIEYDLDNETDDLVIVQLFTNTDNSGNSLFHYEWDNEKDDDSLDVEIETLIQETKRINSLINKIRNKIEQIQDLCDENQLDIENFISINYDFDS
jgi:hypothetical protein